MTGKGAAPTKRFDLNILALTLGGLLLAPIMGGAVGLAIVTSAYQPQGFLVTLGMGAWAGAMFGGLPALVIGLPVHLLLYRLRWTSLWVYVSVGALFGIAVVALWLGVSGPEGLD